MPWLELKIDSDAQRAPALADDLTAMGALSVTLSDVRDEPIYEPALGTEPLWRHTRVTALFDADVDAHAVVAELVRRFGPWIEAAATIGHLADQAWERTWMDHFAPMKFGNSLWICPSWMEPPDPAATNIRMDPGLAFGTGTHPTTALCLEWLDAHPPCNHTVIDYGCGSGVLAVAAAKLGAALVYAVDNDPQALTATRENAQRNDVGRCIRTYAPEQLPAIRADTLLANILANPLLELAPVFSGMVIPGGHVVLSGILAEQAHDVLRAYEPWFEMEAPAHKKQWVRIDGRRRYT
jgi:ribosomal protein L11 methyltransferase